MGVVGVGNAVVRQKCMDYEFSSGVMLRNMKPDRLKCMGTSAWCP